MKDLIRLGIIGCGNITTNAHSLGYNSLKDICRVTATCDLIEDRAVNLANILGADFHTTDYKEMLPYVDAVLVALPHHAHYECGMFFAENNVHILMEKPLCNTEEECVTLADLADEKGITLMCAYPVRYWPAIQKMKELVDSKVYGDVIQMSIWTEQFTKYDEERVKIKKLGGGQLFSHGCHYIDLLLWFLGNPVSGVHFGTNKGTEWMEREGNSNVILTFENGAMGYHFGTWGARGTRHGYDFQIHLTKGFLQYWPSKGKVYFIQNGETIDPAKEDFENEPIAQTEISWKFPRQTKQTEYETRHFLECIKNKTKPLTDARSAIEGLKVIWKLYEAEEKNQIADLRGIGFSK